jgi:hypothetical protein
MSSTDTLYTARFLSPEYVERDRANLIKCRVYRDGALSAPTSGTVTVYNGSGTEVVAAASVTITGDVAEYSIGAVTLAAEELEEAWLFEWALVMGDTITHTFRNEGGCVRRKLYPVITDDDLLRRHTDLSDLRPSGLSSFQDYIDEAWAELQNRIVGDGQRPYLVMSPSAFREPHIYKTLELMFLDFSTSVGDGKFADMSDHYGRLYGIAWNRLNFRYDTDDDGQPDADSRRRSGTSTVWLSDSSGYRPSTVRRWPR